MNLTSILPRSANRAAFDLLQADLVVAFKLKSIRAQHALSILNLHRIADDRRAYASMTPALFDDLVFWLKQRFQLLLFSDLATFEADDRAPLILSFDDGYKDFIDNAAPILEKHRIRVNHNLLPTAIESGLPPMNVMVQDFIVSAPAALLREIPLPGLPQGADPENRTASCLRTSTALKNRPISDQKAIVAGLQSQFARFDGFRPTPMMSHEEVRQISATHEVGAHSYEHATMSSETDDYLREDAGKCLEYFESRFGFSPRVYAFPNGGARPGQADIIREAGFEHVLLVGEDYSRLGAWQHPRFTMYAKSDQEARARALGWFRRQGAVEAG